MILILYSYIHLLPTISQTLQQHFYDLKFKVDKKFFFKFWIHNIYLGPFRNTPWELNVLCYLQELIFKKCEDVGANMIKWYFLTFLSSFLIQFKIYGVYAYFLIFWWPPCLKLVTWTPPKYGNNSQNPSRFVGENIYPHWELWKSDWPP